MMLQYLVVALLVLVAAVYAASKYLPKAWRQRVVYFLRQRGASDTALAGWFDTQSSCGSGCDSCNSCATPAIDAPAEGRRVIRIHSR